MPVIGDDLQFRIAIYDANGNLTTTVISSQVVYDPTFAVIGVAPAFVVNAAGVYTYTLPGANVTTDGEYVAIVKTVDPLVSNPTTAANVQVDVSPAVSVLDAVAASHNIAGTIGALINLITSGAASIAAFWDYLTSANSPAGSMKSYILQQLGLISTGGVTIAPPVDPDNLALILYNDTSYLPASGVTLPTWTNSAWTVYGLTTATVTFYWIDKNSIIDTALGTMVVDSATSIHLTVAHTDVFTLPLGIGVMGYKIVAVLDVAHGSEEVQLVNAALSHLNYVQFPPEPNTQP